MSEPREVFVELRSRLGGPGASVLDQLKRIRAANGTITESDLRQLADEPARPVAAVAGAASFYTDTDGGRYGRRHIRVCEGTSCLAATGGEHVARLERVLGVRRGGCAPDGSVSLEAVRCLGYCYASPAALDGDVPRVGPDLGGLLTNGEAAAGDFAAATAGPAIPFASTVRRPVVLAGLAGGEPAWRVWPEVLAAGAVDRVLAEVTASGLRGRGGAAFPVAAKWTAAAREPAPRYLVVNGDEGDPGSYCDRLLMERDPHRVLEGMALAALAVGARHGLVLVRSEYPAALERLRVAVREACAAGHLGEDVHRSGIDFDVEIVEGAGSYVAGEETALLHALEGLRGDVRPRPPFPTTRGYLGRPTVVNNVETIAAVPWVVRHGGAAYARLGRPEEPGTKLVCLSALFRRPGVYEVELGVPLRHLVEDLGGGLRPPHTLRALQVGGPLGGFLSPDQLDLPLLSGPLARAGAALGHGSLVAVDTSMPAVTLLRHMWAFGAAESCGACAPCRIGTRHGLELAEQAERAERAERGERAEPAMPAKRATGDGTATVAAAQEPLLDVMGVASMCAFGRGLADAVRSLTRVYRDELGLGEADAAAGQRHPG
ncbi:MAG TPA: NAD(P)H-dependent oxidoreductase subunit E [Micromonosporaceae bacterium]|nr:NAD(P)H-dependent oxidoreductase subunit E [Micromonosporaceae bacterium]